MTITEYMIAHGLKTHLELTDHLHRNLMTGKEPVALYACLYCGEILNSPPHENGKEHTCPKGGADGRQDS